MTAQEIADLCVPGMPSSKRGILHRAQTERWPSRQRTGRGGGQEYILSGLPAESRNLIIQVLLRRSEPAAAAAGKTVGETAVDTRSSEAWRHFDQQSQKSKDEATLRAAILDEVQAAIACGMAKRKAVETVGQAHQENAATLYRWQQRVRGLPRADWLPALAPQYAGASTTAECPPEAWDALCADYLRQGEPTFAGCYGRLKDLADKRGWTLPSCRTLQRRMDAEIPQDVQELRRKGPQALKALYPHQERDRSVFTACGAVNADGHKFDVFVKWNDGRIVRPVMVAFQDLYSGMILSYRIGEVESAALVRLAFADLVSTWGIPRDCYLDNGRGFASKWITGSVPWRYRGRVRDTDPQGVMPALGTTVHWVSPYHGQAKPIERGFRDLCDAIAKHPVCTGAYTGNSPMAKPEDYGRKAVDAKKFSDLVAQEIDRHNRKPGRRIATCRGRSCHETFTESYQSTEIIKATTEQRRLLLMAAEGVKLDKSGCVRLFGSRYWSEPLTQYRRRQMVIRFDPQRLADPVHVYTLDGRFVATAERLEAVGFNDAEKAKEHNRARNTFRRKTKEAADALIRVEALDPYLDVAPPEPVAPPEAQVIRPIDFARPDRPRPANDHDEDELSTEEAERLFQAGLRRIAGDSA